MFSSLFGSDGQGKEDGASAQEHPKEQPQQLFGSVLSGLQGLGSKIKAATESVADKALGEFTREQQKFVQSKSAAAGRASALPPWADCGSDEESVKQQILALSADKRNFLRDPPPGSAHQFEFSFDAFFPVALATLAEDDRLEQMRFELVPKDVSEEQFWRNYFYRVSLIKQSSAMTSSKDPATPESSGSELVIVDPVGPSDGAGDEAEDDEALSDAESTTSFTDTHDHDVGADLTELDSTPAGTEEAPAENDDQATETSSAEATATAGDQGLAEGSLPEWEQELQKELQDFELDDELTAEMGDVDLDDYDLGGDSSEAWEAEVEELLEQED